MRTFQPKALVSILAIAAVAAAGVYWMTYDGGASADSPPVPAVSDLNPSGVDEVHISPGEIAATTVSEFQRQLISDGRLTFDEYKSAVAAYISCLERAGGKVESAPVLSARRVYVVRVGVPGGELGAGAIETCRTEYLSLADQLWSMHNAPTEAFLAEARAAFAECLRRGGVAGLPARPGRGELVEWWPGHEKGVDPALFNTCQAESEQDYGLEGFGGA